MKFSVITCTYNNARLLADALRTLAAQSLKEFELIIMDDGSEDNTEEVVNRFRPQLKDCVYVRKAHTGLADSRNQALKRVGGTHVAYLDADDLWAPDYLAVCRRFLLREPEAGIFCCNGYRVSSVGQILGRLYPGGLPPVGGSETTVQQLLDFITYARPSGTVVRRLCYEKVGGFDPRFRIAHDIHWLVRALFDGSRCIGMSRELFLYREHEAAMSRSAHDAFQEWLAIYCELLQGREPQREIRKCCLRITLLLARGLSKYPPSVIREALRPALPVFDDHPFLRFAFHSTHLGISHLLTGLRTTRHFLLGRTRYRNRIDFSLPPREIFNRLRN